MPSNNMLKNFCWLAMEKVLRISLGIFVLAYIAKNLGPTDYGTLSLSTSIIAIITSVAMLGLKNIIVKELLEGKGDDDSDIVYSAFLILMVSCISFLVLICITSLFIDNKKLSVTLSLLSLILVFRPFDVLKDYYDSKVNSKVYSIIDAIIFTVSSLLKITVIYMDYGLYAIALLMVFEVSLSSIILFLYYKSREKPFYKFLGGGFTRRVISQSWPLILSSLAWLIYTKMDQIMISYMMSIKSVGEYSIGTKFTEILQFIPSYIVISSVPLIVRKFKKEYSNYLMSYQLLYEVAILTSLIISIFIFIFSAPLVNTLFGAQYSNSIDVMKIHIFSLIPISMALVSGQFLVYENLQKILMFRHLIGVLTNFLLNLLLIPIYGLNGAAVSTLISLFISNYLFDITSKNTFICFKQKTFGFFFINIISKIYNFVRERYERYERY